jgi:N-acetylglucosaminyl-diphospho-decaprenol L-rhamnosyltransferase
MSRLAIVIVSFNTRAELERCLESLTLVPPTTTHEIIVVDNASTDGSAAAVRRQWPAVRVLELASNVGFARASNLGIRATESEFILLLNSDTFVPPGAIDTLVALLDRRSEVAIVGPRLIDEHGRPELSFGRMIGPFAEARQKLLGWAYGRGLRWAERHVARQTAKEHAPDWVSGACLLVRRRDAEAVGLLDERFFLYAEDVDFCAAVRARGRTVLFTPAAEVVHLGGRAGRTAPKATRRAYRRSQLAFYAKHHPRWLPWLRLYLRLRGQLP